MRKYNMPVLVCGAVRFPEKLKVMRRRVEGEGQTAKQVILDCLEKRKDYGYPWVITGSPVIFQIEGQQVISLFRVDMRRGKLFVVDSTPKRIHPDLKLMLLKGGRLGGTKRQNRFAV